MAVVWVSFSNLVVLVVFFLNSPVSFATHRPTHAWVTDSSKHFYILRQLKLLNVKKSIAVIEATFAVAKRKPESWLVTAQLVRALHRYRRGQWFESRTSLNFFRTGLLITHRYH